MTNKFLKFLNEFEVEGEKIDTFDYMDVMKDIIKDNIISYYGSKAKEPYLTNYIEAEVYDAYDAFIKWTLDNSKKIKNKDDFIMAIQDWRDADDYLDCIVEDF